MKLFYYFLLINLLSSYSYANPLHGKAGHVTSGTTVQIGNGRAYTFVETNADEDPISMGIAFSGSSLQNLPMQDHRFILPLPENVFIPPYEHISIDWNHHGHDPEGIYNVPHFDYHFYFISLDERDAIRCKDDDEDICMKEPAENEIPEYYFGGPDGIPQMGWHWVDIRSPELNGYPFTSTFLYGYYNAHMIFLEPMIALKFLAERGEVDQDLPTPAVYDHSGYYPQHYALKFSSAEDLYRIILSDFKTQVHAQ